MKRIILLALVWASVSCADSTTGEIAKETPLSPAQQIAQAHGINRWDDLNTLAFTFNVQRDTSHFGRRFLWELRSDKVTLIQEQDSLTYLRGEELDSTALGADRSFINDSYWLLAPFKLLWDEGTTISEPLRELAPVSGDTLHKITLDYSGEGGYTPGDSYDFYYDDTFVIREWIYRRGGQAEPSLITTWEDYQNVNGLKLSMMRKAPGGSFRIYFTEVEAN